MSVNVKTEEGLLMVAGKPSLKTVVKVQGNVASMKNDISLSSNDIVKTLGYYEENDGGGAYYKIVDTEPKTGWFETLSNGMYALLCTEDIVNLRQCGIKPNEDIYAKLFEVFKKCCSITHRYYLPAGYYIVSDCVFIPPNSEFFGDGKNTTIYFNGDYLYYGAGISNGGSNVYIHDIKINHKNTENMWTDESIRSFIGGIGLSSYNFDSWNTLHAENLAMLDDVKNLIVRNIWSDSYYPIQTETIDDHAISDVVYDNIVAPNGMVSIYANTTITTGFVQLDNCNIHNVRCKLLRIGQNAQTSERIFVSDIYANMIALAEKGIKASNLHIDYKSNMDIRRYASLLSLAGDDIEITNAYLNGAGGEKRGIALYTAGTVLLNNVITRNIDVPINAVSGTNNQKVMMSNCDFEGKNLMQLNEGYVSNVNAYIASTNNIVNRKQLSFAIPANGEFVVEAKMCTLTAKRNDSAADNLAVYVISNMADGLSYKAVLSSDNVPIAVTKDSSGKIVIRNTGTAYYFCMLNIY